MHGTINKIIWTAPRQAIDCYSEHRNLSASDWALGVSVRVSRLPKRCHLDHRSPWERPAFRHWVLAAQRFETVWSLDLQGSLGPLETWITDTSFENMFSVSSSRGRCLTNFSKTCCCVISPTGPMKNFSLDHRPIFENVSWSHIKGSMDQWRIFHWTTDQFSKTCRGLTLKGHWTNEEFFTGP
jgi:hypothetical protein